MSNRCRYCAAPIDPDWRMEIIWRTRAEILVSTDLWAPQETVPAVQAEVERLKAKVEWSDWACIELQKPIRLRVKVDRAEFCCDLHRRAFHRNRDAVAQAVADCRDDTPGEIPGQGSLL